MAGARPPAGHAAGAGLRARPRRAAPGRHAPHPAAPAQHAAQPDRQGVLAARTSTAIAAVAIEHDLLVVTDEVYEHLVFDGAHVPDRRRCPGMRERTVTISSAGKTFSFTGWKVGWVCAPPELVAAVRTAKQFLTYVSGAPFQPAVAVGLRLPDVYFEEFTDDLRTKRDRLCAGLEEAGLRACSGPAGTYFITTDIRPLGEHDGLAFCRSLPERCGVVAVPNVVFYDDKEEGAPLVRFAFCKRHEVHRRGRRPAEGPRAVKVAAVQHDICWEAPAETAAHVRPDDRRPRRRPAPAWSC